MRVRASVPPCAVDHSSRSHVLIVEDDPQVARVMCRALQDTGFATDAVPNAAAARSRFDPAVHQAVLLDLQLPDGGGLGLVREFRGIAPDVPLLIVTGQRSDADIVRGLEAGADDYLVKPFSVEVLVARVRAVLRRGTAAATVDRVVVVGEMRFDRLARAMLTPHGPLELTPKEYALLEFFLLRPDTLVARSLLLERVWGMDFDPGSNLIDAHVARLRRKLRLAVDTPRLITVRGVGFVLATTARPADDDDRHDDASAAEPMTNMTNGRGSDDARA